MDSHDILLLYLLVAATVITTTVCALIMLFRRHYLVKPSIVFVCYFNLFLQWPSVVYYSEIRERLYLTFDEFVLILSSFPLITVFISLFTFRITSRYIYNTLPLYKSPETGRQIALLATCIACAIVYFSYVPFSISGLYVVLSTADSSIGILAREASKKLLPWFPRYSQVIGSVVLLNMASAIIVYQALATTTASGRVNKVLHCIAAAIVGLAAMAFASIDGSRGPAAQTLLGIVVLFFICKKFTISFRYTFAGILIVLTVPIFLQMMRSNDLNVVTAVKIVFERLFYVRLFAGVAMIEYSEVNGLFGIAAIPRLAQMLGIPPVDAANVVFLSLAPGRIIDSGLANNCFVLSYYSYFGSISIVISIALTLMLDICLLLIRHFVHPTKIALAVVIIITSMHYLTSSDFTTVLITGGIVPWIVVCILLSIGIQRAGKKL